MRPDKKLMVQLCVSIWVAIANGAQFCFGLFTPFMKGYGKFNYTQKEVTTVATVGAVLSFFSLPTGYMFDRYGPRITLISGSIMNAIGWIGMYLLFLDPNEPLLGTNPALLCFFYGFSQLSASFYETGSVLTNLEAFSSQQGRIVILQKTFMGLGSSVITTYYVAFFEEAHDISRFCLFLAIFATMCGVVGSMFVKLPNASTRVKGINGMGKDKDSGSDNEETTPIVTARPATVESGNALAPPVAANAARESYNSTTNGSMTSETTIALGTSAPNSNGTVSRRNTDVVDAIANGNATAGEEAERLAAMRQSVPMDVEEPDDEVRKHIELLEEQRAGKMYDRAFYVGYAVLFVCMVFLTGTAIVEDYVDVSRSVKLTFGILITGMVLSFFFMVIALPSEETRGHGMAEPLVDEESSCPSVFGRSSGHQAIRNGPEHTTAAAPTAGVADVYDDEPGTPPSKLLRRSHDHAHHYKRHIAFTINERSMPENMKHQEMWLLWYVSFAVWGAGIIVSNNSAQIYRALDYDRYSETVNTVFVSIFGVASALGRIIVGFIHPRLEARGMHISFLFPAAPIMNVIGMPLFLLIPNDGLIVPFFIAGLSTGFSWGTTVLIIKALFVQRNVGKHYNVLYTAGMLTPLVFSIGLFASVYDYHSDEQGRQHDHSCKGSECVMWPLLVPAILNVFAIGAAWQFYRRIRDRGGFV